MQNAGYVVYVVLFLLIILVPFAGLALPGAQPTEEMYAAEKRDLAPMPEVLQPDGTLNVSFLGGFGDWFEDHMAFRDKWISADSFLRSRTVGSDADDKVIMGRDGWLYYHGTEDDFLGRSLMSDRELFDAAHNLKLMQRYTEEHGCRFVFVAAVNKNSLFPEHMPSRYLRGTQSNARNLIAYLDRAGVRYADLYEALSGTESTYFLTDTHWNGRGALIGYNNILDELDVPHESYGESGWTERADHIGDLEEMLYPGRPSPETDYYPDVPQTYAFAVEPETLRDPLIRTDNPAGSGCLYMFRDSFADALIPLFSQHYAQATYSTYRPWNFPEAVQVPETDVVAEIVERNLIDLVNRPAILPAPEITEAVQIREGYLQTEGVRAERDGPYVCISGRVGPEIIGETGQIVVRVKNNGEIRAYAPFYTSNKERLGNSFYLYLRQEDVSDSTVYVEICAGNGMLDLQTVFADSVPIEPE